LLIRYLLVHRIPYIALAGYLLFGAYTYFFSGGSPKGKVVSLEEASAPQNPKVFFEMQVSPTGRRARSPALADTWLLHECSA
jgi:hypothetical protein